MLDIIVSLSNFTVSGYITNIVCRLTFCLGTELERILLLMNEINCMFDYTYLIIMMGIFLQLPRRLVVDFVSLSSGQKQSASGSISL